MRALAKTCLILSLVLLATSAFARQEPPARVGRVSIVEGALAFYGPGDTDWSAAKVNFPVAENGWFATDPNSRAEFRIGADSTFLANNTEEGFTWLREKDMQLALQHGRIALHLRQLNRGSNAEVDIARGGIWLQKRGEYDIDSGDAERPTRITVFDGSARFVGGGVDITINAGDALILSGTDTLSATVEPATVDEFVRWCRAHDYHEDRLAAPYHVSPSMTGFEELDTYGVWAREADYGEVWFPKSVPAGWAPYREGHWVWIEPWGWNWVGDEPWGFAPCHYGRWARIHDRWAWVPGEFVPEPAYAPALVAFIPPPAIEVAVPAALGPPVGWFPLAPGEIYWPSYTRDPTYIRNVNITHVNVTVINKITQAAIAERAAAPPSVVVNQTFANRSAATVVPATVMTTAANAAPAAIKLPPQTLEKASVSVRPPQIVALPIAVVKPAGNAATAPAAGAEKGPASGQTAAPPAPNAPSAVLTAKSAGRPPVRPDFSQLAPAPQLARTTAQTATQTTAPGASPHPAGTPERHPGQATAAIPPAGTRPVGPPQQRLGQASAIIPPPTTAPAGERQQQPAQTTTEPAPGAHSAAQQPNQATIAPPAPGRPPGPPDFSHLAPSRGVHPGQPGHPTTSATAGSQPSPGLRPVGQPETKTVTPGPVHSSGAPEAAPQGATPPTQMPGLAPTEPASHPGAPRTAGGPAPSPSPVGPSPHAASTPAAKQELVPQRAPQEEFLRQQAQQRAATEASAQQQKAAAEAAARQQAQQRAAAEAAAQQQKAAAETAARQQAQQRAAAEAATQQQRAAAEAAARQQAQRRAAAEASAQQQKAAAEAAARQQAQQRAAAEATARQQAQQSAAQQHAAAPHACGHPGEPPCPK